ncbi:Peptidase C48 SUMO/Sentrin/Ubl1 [Macrophomina phaseolina MS6]|uniref:Peptidase C48 SUMO/Sentrin/Ubl1 n=1 Tax=Macrophomina phaseolina (strain MS6) TaxID=1126212 RepID=K2RPR3_MACPH|nr:Peptidase C48 SUMO/Sentrin/Ubl1 [Macrophomina phaseolina MS6]
MPTINIPTSPEDRTDDHMHHHTPYSQRAIDSLPFQREYDFTYIDPATFKRKLQPGEKYKSLVDPNYRSFFHTSGQGDKNDSQNRIGIATDRKKKRKVELYDDLDEKQTMARQTRIEPEPKTSFFSRLFSTIGVWVNKCKDRQRDNISQLFDSDDQPEEIIFVPTGFENFSKKRRIVNRPMPGAFAPDSPIRERPKATAAADSVPTQNPKFITNNHTEHSPAAVLQTSYLPAGFTSSIEHGNRRVKVMLENSSMPRPKGVHAKLKPTKNSKNIIKLESQTGNFVPGSQDVTIKTESQTGIHGTQSDTELASTSQGHETSILKCAHEAIAEDGHDVTSDKIRRAGTPTKKGIRLHKNIAGGHLGVDVIAKKNQSQTDDEPSKTAVSRPPFAGIFTKRFAKQLPQRQRISKVAITISARNEGAATIRDRKAIKGRKDIKDIKSITPSEHHHTPAIIIPPKTQNILDITQPSSVHNITQVRMSNSLSDKAESSSAALFNDPDSFNTYREPEERPSTSSSNRSDETKEMRQKNQDSPTKIENTGTAINNADDNEISREAPVSKKDLHSEHNGRQKAPRSRKKDGHVDDQGKAEKMLEWHMNFGGHIDLRNAKSQSLEELMKQGSLLEAENQLEELEISDNRKGAREQEELEKKLKAQAEAKREAEEAKAAEEARQREAEAIKRAEEEAEKREEEAKLEKRRKTLDQEITAAAQNNILSALKRHPAEELKQNLRVQDLRTLVPKTDWLNDEVVNYFIGELVKKACEKRGYTDQDKKAGKAPPYANILSQFWGTLSQKGVQAVRGWARAPKLDKGRLLECERVFIPICHSLHWRLVVISGTEKTIEYFDSLNGSAHPYANKVLEWVELVLGSAFDAQQWRIIQEQRSPRQSNGSDCGVFVLQNARAVVLGLNFEPNMYQTSTEGILRVRHQIADHMLSGSLDWE